MRILEPEEIEQFHSYLNASLFRTRSELQLKEFFAHCRHLEVWNTELDRENFLKKSDLEMSNNTFDKQISKIYNLLMEFAGLKGLLQQPVDLYPYALKFLAGKSVDPQEIDKKVAESHQKLKNTLQNADFFRISLDLRLALATVSQGRTEKPADRGLSLLHSDLDAYYFIQKLRFLCASRNEQYVFGHQWAPEAKAELQGWLESSYDLMPDLGRSYYHAWMILCGNDDPVHFEKFRALLAQWESSQVENPETTDLYGYLLNYFSLRLNNGDLEVLPLLENLFDDLIRRGTILEDGKISPEYFKNVIAVKCRLGKTEAARTFFAQFGSRLTRTQEGTALRYNEVYISFHEGRYGEVQISLEALIEAQEAGKVDQYYGLDLRCLLLKTYYSSLSLLDLRAWDEAEEKLLGLLRSFRGYIDRKDISLMSKIRFENFRKAVHRLYQLYYALSESEDPEAGRRELLIDFNSSSNLPDKGWFISQVQDRS